MDIFDEHVWAAIFQDEEMMNSINASLLPPPCFQQRQCAPLNIARQVPLEWALPLYGYTMPVIVALTVATNSFIVIVLSHKYLRTPTNYVLLAMAVSELLTGLCCIPWFLYYYTFGGYETDAVNGLPAIWCALIPYLASFLPSIFHTTAIWLTVYLAIQRYVYICIPTLVRRFCTIQRSKQVIFVIWFMSISIYAPDAFANYHQSKAVFNPYTNATIRMCYRTQSEFLLWIGPNLYYKVFYTVHTCFVHFVPCLLLVIFTWKLIKAIRMADKRHAHLLNRSIKRSSDATNGTDRRESLLGESLVRKMSRIYKHRGSEPKRVQGLKQNTRMLIVVIMLFLLTEVPAAAIFSVHVLSVSFKINWGHYHLLNILLIVRNVLIVISYPFRFAIYCGMSQQFREVVQKMFTTRLFPTLTTSKHTDSTTIPVSNIVHDQVKRNLSTNGTQASWQTSLSKAEIGVQCDPVSEEIVFDPLFDDVSHLMANDETYNRGHVAVDPHHPNMCSRSSQCSVKLDQEMFIRRKSSLVANALLENSVRCHMPVVISFAT